MPNIVSNPLFQVIILFIVTTGIWFIATDETYEIKKKILSFLSDILYYFILASFGLNLLFNFREIIREPYRILLISSESYWMALVAVMFYLTIQASQQEQVLREEAEEPNKDIEFGQSDDLEEDIELDEDASEKKQRWITCSFLWSK